MDIATGILTSSAKVHNNRYVKVVVEEFALTNEGRLTCCTMHICEEICDHAPTSRLRSTRVCTTMEVGCLDGTPCHQLH